MSIAVKNEKIYNSITEFSKIIVKLKKKIVLCHGVFDLYHAGHLNYFEEARKCGDILIVSVTSDKYVIKHQIDHFLSLQIEPKLFRVLA